MAEVAEWACASILPRHCAGDRRIYPKIRIDCRLIGVRGWPGDLITADAQNKWPYSKAMIEPGEA